MNSAKKKFIAIISAIGGVLLAIMIVVTCVCFSMAENMNMLFGRGKKKLISSGTNLNADYIDFKTDNQPDSKTYAAGWTQKTAEEGMVLLKNEDNTLPLKGDTLKVTLLDYWGWHNNMAGGEDPATTAGAVSLYKGVSEDKDIQVNEKVIDTTLGSDVTATQIATKLARARSSFAEYKTAIVTIKRNSGEGNDQTVRVATAGEGGRTGLTVNTAELAILNYACNNFEKVIVVINSVNTMELGFLQENDPHMTVNGTAWTYTDPYGQGSITHCEKITAAIWAGGCGSQAGKALANILKGSVNPSGHLSDIHARDLTKDPTYKNFGSYEYSNSADLNSYSDHTYFVEYEEDIYIGYRYYETAAFEASKGNYEGFDYDEAVVFPFGYGLSYTTFSQEFVGEPTYDPATESYTFKVKVTNKGEVAGKGVAQIYVSVPYSAGQVEKAHVVLGGFAKTDILSPKASEDLTITISKDYFESYDYITEKAYLLDAGTYKFYLAMDEYGSHSWAEIDKIQDTAEKAKRLWTTDLEKEVFKGTKKRASDEKTATNIMDNELNWKFKNWSASATSGDGYIYNFTRSNFKGSFPTSPTGNDFKLTNDYALKYAAKYNVWGDTENAVDESGKKIEEKPETNVDKTTYTLADMRGVDIDDEKWDDFINQFTVESMAYMFGNGGWGIPGDEENGVPATLDADSPYGYYAMAAGISSGKGNTWYCSAPMVAATFNVELAKELGYAFAEEAHQLIGNSGGYINGVYGFGMNQHRSAFGGRNYEYYSEDPVLCGKMGAAEASAASEKGLVCYMKHYVLNDQETNRQNNGYCAWVNEQAFREVYLRAWEIYIKEATMEIKYHEYNKDTDTYETDFSTKTMSAATGIMTCYNRIGSTYGGASVSINGILRNEWNFTGTVLTDAGGQPTTYMTTDLALRRGQNLCLANNGAGTSALFDAESATAVWWLKNSTRYLLYNLANSNAVLNLAPGDKYVYETAPWVTTIIVCWVIVGLLVVGAVVVDVLVAKDIIKLKEKKVTKTEGPQDEEY